MLMTMDTSFAKPVLLHMQVHEHSCTFPRNAHLHGSNKCDCTLLLTLLPVVLCRIARKEAQPRHFTWQALLLMAAFSSGTAQLPSPLAGAHLTFSVCLCDTYRGEGYTFDHNILTQMLPVMLFELVTCREGDPDSSWKPVYCVALKALGNDTLNLLCNRLSFPEPEVSFKLLAGSLLGDIIACSYAAVESAADLQVCCHPTCLSN